MIGESLGDALMLIALVDGKGNGCNQPIVDDQRGVTREIVTFIRRFAGLLDWEWRVD